MSTLALDGELTFATVPARLKGLSREAYDVVDVTAVSRLDSAGAALLLELARRNGGQLSVAGASAQARHLLQFLEIDTLLDLS